MCLFNKRVRVEKRLRLVVKTSYRYVCDLPLPVSLPLISLLLLSWPVYWVISFFMSETVYLCISLFLSLSFSLFCLFILFFFLKNRPISRYSLLFVTIKHLYVYLKKYRVKKVPSFKEYRVKDVSFKECHVKMITRGLSCNDFFHFCFVLFKKYHVQTNIWKFSM